MSITRSPSPTSHPTRRRSRRAAAILAAAAATPLLALGGLTAPGALAAVAAPTLATTPPATITSLSFQGTGGPNAGSPTVTITGSGFGSVPAGVSDNNNHCAHYTNNGDLYGSTLYFQDDTHFEAGHGKNTPAGDCMGIIISSWSATQVVLEFGNAYGTNFPGSGDHWYLSNGDGYAISIKGGIFGGDVSGLS